MNFNLAIAQIDPTLGDLKKNVQKHVDFATRAADAGADLVVFPELSLSGYTIKDMNWDLAVNPEEPPSDLEPLLQKSKSISIIAGGVEDGPGFGIFNAAFLFEEGLVRTVHRKAYPPTYGMFEEMRYFSRGTSVRAFDSKLGRMGVLICEDLWHPSLPYLLAMDGASLIVGLVATPTRISGANAGLTVQTVNYENHKAYARLLSVYLAFCNRVGFEDGVNFWGGSSLVGPDGEITASAELLKEDLIVQKLDDSEIRRARRFSRHFLDEDPNLVIRELRRMQDGRG